jgi:hypothetical protein
LNGEHRTAWGEIRIPVSASALEAVKPLIDTLNALASQDEDLVNFERFDVRADGDSVIV